jgi:succinylglutamate desuccinylase
MSSEERNSHGQDIQDILFHNCGCHIRLIRITIIIKRRIKFQIQESEHIWQYTGVPEGQVNILGGHSISHSKQKSAYILFPIPNGS